MNQNLGSLVRLDGIDDNSTSDTSGNVDAQDLLGLEGQIGDLGRRRGKFFKKSKLRREAVPIT